VGVIGICPLAATSDCPEAANPVTERGEDGFEQVQIPVVLRVRWLYAASESCAQISLYVVGSRPSRAVPHVARSPERITGQVNRD
jgi:hypothetical protein